MSLVHEKLRGTKGTGNDFRELGRQYRALSNADKTYYEMLGTAATTARREGRVSFPAQSSTASYLRHQHCPEALVIPKTKKKLEDPLVRVTCQDGRNLTKIKRSEVEEMLSGLRAFAEGGADVLRKHRLLEYAGVSWLAFLHSTVGLIAVVTADRLEHTRFPQRPPVQLERDSIQQHHAIPEHSFSTVSTSDSRTPDASSTSPVCSCWSLVFAKVLV